MTSNYGKTFEKALYIQRQTLLGMVVVTFAAEIAFFFVISAQGSMEVGPGKYILKYILLPSSLNAICAIAACYVCKAENLSLKRKEYAVSLLAVAMSFVIALNHAAFSSVYLLFALMIMFTVFYGDRYLTTAVFIASLIGRCVSAIYCIDPSVVFQGEEFSELLLAAVLLCGTYVLSLTIIRLENEKRGLLRKSMEAWGQMKEASRRDVGTNLLNRRALQDFQDSGMIAGWGSPRFLAMWDIDGFKQINDTYGHLQGDEILKFIGSCCQECSSDMICFRYGGDEFCALLFDDQRQAAEERLENLQRRLSQYSAEEEGPQAFSISIGFTDYEKDAGLEKLMLEADQAMYRAKRSGKGCICFFKEKKIKRAAAQTLS